MDPDTLTQLAATFSDAHEPEADRMAALAGLIAAYDSAGGAVQKQAGEILARVLQPIAQQMARTVARSGSRQDRQDLADEALSLLFTPIGKVQRPRICTYQAVGSSLGEFRNWLCRTLGNCWRSELRRAAARPAQALGDYDPEAHPGQLEQRLRELASDPEVPYSPSDLAILEEMPLDARVEGLAVVALWTKVPPTLWEQWLCAYEQDHGLRCPRPFPPPELLWEDHTTTRAAVLAGPFQKSKLALVQRKYRDLPFWLSRLCCYRELEE